MEPLTGPPKTFLTISTSIPIIDGEDVKATYEKIKTAIRGIRPDSMVTGTMMKMMEKCCGDKKP